jgi:arylsulfatase A-like enzyme
MDAGVGRVLDRLERLGVAGDTLVFFLSDNGPEVHRAAYSRGSAWPLKGMKTQLWEGGTRVPCIIRWPGRVPAGRTSAALASVLDVLPAACAAAGAHAPADLDGGVDLVRLASGGNAGRALFFEFHFPQRGVEPSLPMAVRRGKWKLLADHDFSSVHLYDLVADIGEVHDLAGQNPGVAASLLRELEAWWRQFRIELPPKTTRVPTPSPEELDKRYYRN